MDLAQSPGAVGTRSDVQPVLKMETVLVALLETHMRTPSKAIPIGTETLGPEAKGLPETWLPSRLKTETSFDPPLTTHMCFPSNPRAQGPPPAANGLPGICVPSALNTETVCAAALASREWTSQNLSSVDDGCRFWHFARGFWHFGTESQFRADSGTLVPTSRKSAMGQRRSGESVGFRRRCPHNCPHCPNQGRKRIASRRDNRYVPTVFESAPEGIRTPNLLIRSQMLYPLSYGRPVQA